MKAGFAEIDITPPLGTGKIGWMKDLAVGTILGPLSARMAIFENEEVRLGFIQLDTLSVRWSHAEEIRRRIGEAFDFPGQNVMVSASHNHAGPALAGLTPVHRDEAYAERVTQRCVEGFGAALQQVREAEIGVARSLNFDVPHNRRTMMRDGTTRTQTASTHPDYLCLEGPVDPEVVVLAVRGRNGGPLLGTLVNFACHPVHHGGTDEVCGGFPGRVCELMKECGCPVCLYLNGAYGNVIDVDFERCRRQSMREIGQSVFASVREALDAIEFRANPSLYAASETIRLPFREITEAEYHGTVRGAQRFRSDELYEAAIDALKERIAREKTQPAQVQVLGIGDVRLAGIPAEYFVEHQLRIKMETYPLRSLVVGGANGMVGYVPTAEAFKHGGYETTLGPPSRLAPEAGDLLADKAIELIKREASI